jgi:hypothetical protein
VIRNVNVVVESCEELLGTQLKPHLITRAFTQLLSSGTKLISAANTSSFVNPLFYTVPKDGSFVA